MKNILHFNMSEYVRIICKNKNTISVHRKLFFKIYNNNVLYLNPYWLLLLLN